MTVKKLKTKPEDGQRWEKRAFWLEIKEMCVVEKKTNAVLFSKGDF